VVMWKTYIGDQKGHFSIIFAIVITVILMAIAVSIDSSNAYRHRAKMQDLADAAVLAAAASGEQTQAKLEDIAQDSVASNNLAGTELDVTLTILGDNTLQVTVSASIDTLLMGMFGRDAIDISGLAEAPPKGINPLNIALILDSTQSMEGSKMTALRSAANNLVDSLENDDGDVQISVVPFARYTRIPRSYDSEPWLEINPSVNSCWMVHDPDNSVNCDPVTYDEDENKVYNCEIKVEKEQCAFIEYNGCVASRHAPHHLEAGFVSQRIQGFTAGGSCATELQPLTTSFADVRNTIAAIDTRDRTYMPSGLIWGWRSLTPDAPMTEANTADFDERLSAMVLMSDGENTQSLAPDTTNDFGFNGVYHWGEDIENANSVTSSLCANIKNDAITIYTIAYEVTDAATQTLLTQCASSPSHAYQAGSAAELNSAFESIGEKLAQVRLSR